MKPVNAGGIDTAIQMLGQYLDAEEIKPMIADLEALKAEPENSSCLDQVTKAFNCSPSALRGELPRLFVIARCTLN
jgi:hypothetical protein